MALEMARRTLEDTKLRVEIGTAAPIDTAQPDLTVATSEQSLLQAEIGWRNAELTLKNLLIGGLDDELNKATINPIDRPVELNNPPQIDVQAAMQTALAEPHRRHDLAPEPGVSGTDDGGHEERGAAAGQLEHWL